MSSQSLSSGKTAVVGVQSWRLASNLNQSLDTTLAELPRRCIFCNETIKVTLTGFLPGQGAHKFVTSCQLFLVVTHGVLTVELLDQQLHLAAGQVIALSTNAWFRLSASHYANFLLISGTNCLTCPDRGERTDFDSDASRY